MITAVIMVVCLLVLMIVAIVIALRQEAARAAEHKVEGAIGDRNEEQYKKRDIILRSHLSVNDALVRLYKRVRRDE